jgi:hypothetical protein
MGPIRDPPAFTLDILTRRDRGCCPYDGNEVTVTTDFDAKDAETGLLAMEGHALDRTSQGFRGMGTGGSLGRRFHGLTTLCLEMRPKARTRTQSIWGTMVPGDSQDAHGEKHTTHLSSEQERDIPPRMNGPGGKARGLASDLASRATSAVTLGGTG